MSRQVSPDSGRPNGSARIRTACAALALLSFPLLSARASAPAPEIQGGGRFHVYREFPAVRLGGVRRVTVFLPPDYHSAPARRYPVLYLHDGQNVFDAHRAAFGVEWRVDETIDAQVASGKLASVIAVAVDNAGSHRVEEYTPPLPGGGGGRASVYGDFLAFDLKPFIDGAYRTQPGPGTTAVMGSSLGGILSLHVARHHPESFGLAGCMSPSFWWNHRQVLEEWRDAAEKGPARLWIDIGTAEGDDEDGDGVTEPVEDARDARILAWERGYKTGKDLGYLEDPGAEHNEHAWAGRLPHPLVFLFGGPASDAGGSKDKVKITFSVTVPGTTPAGSTIYVTGNVPELGAWSPAAAIALAPDKGGWKGSVLVPRGSALQFKFTRGSWDTVEKDAYGHELPNRKHDATKTKTIKAAVAKWRDEVE